MYIYKLRNECLSSRWQEKMKQIQERLFISENTKNRLGNKKEYTVLAHSQIPEGLGKIY